MKKLICFLILVMLVSGCGATTSKLTPKLALGMTKQEVLAKCGTPRQLGAMQTKDGQVIENFIYEEGRFWNIHGLINTYIYFIDGKVVCYGGDPTMLTEKEYREMRRKTF